jgi:hypothetical protein
MSNVPNVDCVTTAGVQPGQVVGVDAANDLALVGLAEQKLIARMRRAIDAMDMSGIGSGMEVEQIRSTPFRVWHERGPIHGPDGSYLGHGYRICIAVPDNAHQRVRNIAEHLPSHIEQIQVWLEPWSERPGTERND